MRVYETGEFCAHQQVWIDDEYENEGHGVDADGDPESDDVSMYDFRSREEAIKSARRALASTSADRSHYRDIARLVLRSIGEDE
jgi:hypothetical protein